MPAQKKKTADRFGVSGGLLLLCLAAYAAARRNPAWVTAYYRPVSKAVSGALGSVFSLVPRVPAAELCVYLLAAALLTKLILRLCGRARPPRRGWTDRASRGCLACAGALCFFLFAWGLNYFASPLAGSVGLTDGDYTEQELFAAAEHYLDRANEAAENVARRPDGTFDSGGYAALAGRAPDAMRALARRYPVFEGAAAPPKAVIASRVLSRFGITGVYNPFFGECNVNTDVPDTTLPFTMLHEMAHRLGVAPEDEANFAAFLACAESGDPAFAYAGYYHAFLYCYNALGAQDRAELAARMGDGLRADCRAAAEHYLQYAGGLEQAGTALNDAYLKALGQASGVQSYDEAVDLLVAYHAQGGDS